MRVEASFETREMHDLSPGDLCIAPTERGTRVAVCLTPRRGERGMSFVYLGGSEVAVLDTLVPGGLVLSFGSDWTIRLPAMPEIVSFGLTDRAPSGTLVQSEGSLLLKVARADARLGNTDGDLVNLSAATSHGPSSFGDVVQFSTWTVWRGNEGPHVLGAQPVAVVKAAAARPGFLTS